MLCRIGCSDPKPENLSLSSVNGNNLHSTGADGKTHTSRSRSSDVEENKGGRNRLDQLNSVLLISLKIYANRIMRWILKGEGRDIKAQSLKHFIPARG